MVLDVLARLRKEGFEPMVSRHVSEALTSEALIATLGESAHNARAGEITAAPGKGACLVCLHSGWSPPDVALGLEYLDAVPLDVGDQRCGILSVSRLSPSEIAIGFILAA
jgi:hypothetical protein